MPPQSQAVSRAINAAPVRKLTAKQKALVDHILTNACTVKEAAEIVGYADFRSAYGTLKLPHIQAYILQQTSQFIGNSSMIAAARVAKLCTSAKSEYVQLEASKDILDRAGFKPPERSQVQVSQDITVHIDLGD